ncbi:MAG: CBS domain-containing protein [Gammaproteobacteria bacterium]
MNQAEQQTANYPISNIMQREVLAVDADWPLEKLAEFLVDNSISGAPVTDAEDKLIGVVSLTDIVRQNSLPDSGADTGTAHDVYLYDLQRHLSQDELRVFHSSYESPVTVRDIMTPMIFKVSEDANVQEVAETMLRGRIHRVFVTRGKKLTGIVTALDMLQVIRDL